MGPARIPAPGPRPAVAGRGARRLDRVTALHQALGNRAFASTFAPRVLARDAVTWKHNDKLAPGEPDRLYNQAVKNADWQLLLGVIDSFADDKDVLGLLRPIEQQGRAGLLAAQLLATSIFRWPDDHPIRRGLAFLLVKSDVGRHARTQRNTGHDLGTANGGQTAVPGGAVAIYDAVRDPRGLRDDWFALQYTGTDVEDTGWLQFVAPEVEAFDAGTGGDGEFVHGSMTGRYQSDEEVPYGSSSRPNWHLDTISDTLPFYESADKSGNEGSAIVVYDTPGTPSTPGHAATSLVPGQTTMIDRPQADPSIVKKAFSHGVHRVERRLRFHEYLVRGEDVLFENEFVVQDTYWHPDETPVRHNLVGKRGPVDRLRPPHFQALIRRRPGFGYFAHDRATADGD